MEGLWKEGRKKRKGKKKERGGSGQDETRWGYKYLGKWYE
jgi:hypothetical protein